MAAMALLLSRYKGRVILHWHSDIIKQKFFLTLYKPLQSWVIRRAELIIGTTPVYVSKSPYLQKVQDKVRSIPIGIRPVEYDTSTAEAIRRKFSGCKIIFSLGRLVEYKGFKYLIEAASLLPDDYKVVIGGTGPLRDELEEQIRRSGLEDKVILTGYLSDEKVKSWYGSCDVYVVSSIMKTEAFCIAQVEAMSCRKPVVCTDIPGSGTSWVNKNGVSGINVRPENPVEIADAVLSMTSDADTIDRFSSGAFDRYEKMFKFERMIESLISLYKN